MRRLCLMLAAAAVAAGCSYEPPPQPSPTPSAGDGAAVTVPERRPTNFVAHLAADNEVPPNPSRAQGQVIFQLNAAGTELSYRLISSNIDNVIAAHIHLGGPDENGPVVQFLFGPAAAGGGAQDGVLATGTIDGSGLAGPLAGMDLSALIDAMRAGNTYVNVHTNDGDGGTSGGPGDIPGGEIRGQVRVAGR